MLLQRKLNQIRALVFSIFAVFYRYFIGVCAACADSAGSRFRKPSGSDQTVKVMNDANSVGRILSNVVFLYLDPPPTLY